MELYILFSVFSKKKSSKNPLYTTCLGLNRHSERHIGKDSGGLRHRYFPQELDTKTELKESEYYYYVHQVDRNLTPNLHNCWMCT